MKRIIDGKTYNTETSTLIDSIGDPHKYTFYECLYITNKGNFFLMTLGRKKSLFVDELESSIHRYNNDMYALTVEQVKEWYSYHGLDIDTIIKYLPEIEEA